MRSSIRMKYLTRDDVQQLHGLGETVKDRVDEVLAVKGMTQREFGRRAGITNRGYQGSWWSGVRRQIAEGRFNPSMGMVLRFARALRVRPDDLLEEFK